MHVISSCTAALVLGAVARASSGPVAQLRLSPSPVEAVPESVGGARVSLSPVEANAVLAHHLGVSGYEHLPVTNNKQWEHALGTGDGSAAGQKIVVVMECPTQGCDGEHCQRARGKRQDT